MDQQRRVRLRFIGPSAAVATLNFAAAAAALAGLFSAAAYLILSSYQGPLTFQDWLRAIAWAFAGLGAGSIIWASAWIARLAHENALLQRSVLAQFEALRAAEQSVAQAMPAQQDQTKLLERLVGELREVNANLLLTDAQRDAKNRRRNEMLSAQLIHQAEAALSAGEFAAAQRVLEQLIDSVPDEPNYPHLQRRLDEARANAQREDIRRYSQQIEDCLAVASFAQGRKLAAELLLGRHPGSAQAIELSQRVEREAENYIREQRRRLYAEADQAAAQKKWRAAYGSARRLVETYPNSPEAEAVGAQLETLHENARIEEVREIRDRIRQLLEQKRFAEALFATEDLIERFPETQAAADLRGQIDKMRDLARQQQAGPPQS